MLAPYFLQFLWEVACLLLVFDDPAEEAVGGEALVEDADDDLLFVGGDFVLQRDPALGRASHGQSHP